MGMTQRYDKDVNVIEGVRGYGEVQTFVAVAELQYRMGRRDFLRVEVQHLWATQVDEEWEKQIDGNWAFGLVEGRFSYPVGLWEAAAWYCLCGWRLPNGSSIQWSVFVIHREFLIDAVWDFCNNGVDWVGSSVR